MYPSILELVLEARSTKKALKMDLIKSIILAKLRIFLSSQKLMHHFKIIEGILDLLKLFPKMNKLSLIGFLIFFSVSGDLYKERSLSQLCSARSDQAA